MPGQQPHPSRAGTAAPVPWEPLRALRFGEGRQPGVPAGLLTPDAAATFVNVLKYPRRVRVGVFLLLIAGWFLYLKEKIISAFWRRNPSLGTEQAGESSPGRSSAHPFPHHLPFVHPDPFRISAHSSPLLSPSSCLSDFTLPSYLERWNWKVLRSFWRQPSPFVSAMASGDNNSAAAPDLLASITLQDQLIPVKITSVTEG